ncbi:MAG: pseudouridine synthase [Gammaproteobacteria bacterium]|nr:pseudouridine synthase [Gammaproteobacteria bacterium]
MNYSPPPDTGLDILFQDQHLLVVNKPADLLSVPGRTSELKDCLATRVQNQFPDALIVHRLDMATSGIMVMALNKGMHRQLSMLFQDRQVNKTYTAIVDGQITNETGEIDLPLITDWPNRPKQKVDYEIGKPSVTRYTVLGYDAKTNTTRIELKPVTGRSHQLRVHMLSLGHAILGDRLYASPTVVNKSDRLLLHASELCFAHPSTAKKMHFISEASF